MLKYIFLGLAVVIAAFLVVVATRPGEFKVSRAGVVAAPPALAFEQVNTLRNWDSWSPWAKLDPNVKNTFEGPASGPGAAFAWDGNKEVGAGKMTILDSKPAELVRLRLDFERPFKSTSDVEFTFQPEGEQTRVTWTMSGKNNFIGKAFSMFMDCDKMIGGDFEKGLAQMNKAAQTAAVAAR